MASFLVLFFFFFFFKRKKCLSGWTDKDICVYIYIIILAASYDQEGETFSVLFQGTTVPPGPNPPNLVSKQFSFLPPVLYDTAPMGKNFGDIKVDAQPSYVPVSIRSKMSSTSSSIRSRHNHRLISLLLICVICVSTPLAVRPCLTSCVRPFIRCL